MWPALIGAGASILGSVIQSKSAGRAADQQQDAAAKAIKLQRTMYNQGRKDFAPYRSTGIKANNRLGSLLGLQGGQHVAGFGSLLDKFTGQDLYEDPGYQFRLEEGLKGLQNSAAARGNQFSGATMKGLGRYAQDYASNEFGNARNRFIGDQDQTYNYLTGPTQRGVQSASASVGVAQNNANAQGGYITGAGNAASAGTIASGNALSSGINQAYNAYQDSQQQQRLNALLRNNGRTYAPYGGGAGMYQGR